MEWLKDSKGNLLGYTQQSGQNIQIKHKTGNILGSYRPADDRTYDKFGNLIGRGNLLPALLMTALLKR